MLLATVVDDDPKDPFSIVTNIYIYIYIYIYITTLPPNSMYIYIHIVCVTLGKCG